MNIKELLRQADKLGRNYDAIFLLLHDASYEILKERKVSLTSADVEEYLDYSMSIASLASDYLRAGVLTEYQGKLMDVIVKNGWKMIVKYNVQDLHIKMRYLRSMIVRETDPDKLSKMRKEKHELALKIAAMD